MPTTNPAIPAATLILFRERDNRPAEHLMIERARNLKFAAGAMVFPGGRVDEQDHQIAIERARNKPADLDDAAARVAAIRETIEETGVAVGIDPLPDAATLTDWRIALNQGESFASLLADSRAKLDLNQLISSARWLPNFAGLRRFDTRFYLARMTANVSVQVDGGEATRHVWMTAQRLLEDAEAGRHHMIFPTRRNLERLAAFPAFEAAAAHARTIEPRTITPWVQTIDGQKWLCIPDDAGYPIVRAPLAEALKDEAPPRS